VQKHSAAISNARHNDRIVNEFASFLQQVQHPDQVQAGLVQMVFAATGAEHVELHRNDTAGQSPRRVACWPEVEDAKTSTSRAAILARPALRLPLNLGGRLWGTLHLICEHPPKWSARQVRRVTTLGVMAAATERALRAARGAGLTSPLDPVTGLYNQPFLEALLAYAGNQAVRRREPLALLYIGLDPMTARDRLRHEITDAMMQRVARAIVGTLRASDIVARLDDDRIVAILPAAGADDAPAVAEAVRLAILEAGMTSAAPADMTASIGVAAYPDHGEETEALQTAAAAALVHAQARGGNRVVLAARRETALSLRIVPCEL
jgi:diguanylate cyclase (GGDEF)-like protein